MQECAVTAHFSVFTCPSSCPTPEMHSTFSQSKVHQKRYCNNPVGRNKLATMVKCMCEQVGLKPKPFTTSDWSHNSIHCRPVCQKNLSRKLWGTEALSVCTGTCLRRLVNKTRELYLVWSAWAATQIDFLHLKFVVNGSRLAYWLGKPVDASRKSEKMAPSKLTHRKYFLYLCFLYTCFCAVLKHFCEVNSRVGIHSLSTNDKRFSTSQQH